MIDWSLAVNDFAAYIFAASNPIRCYGRYCNNPEFQDTTILLFDSTYDSDVKASNIKFKIGNYSIFNLGDYDKTIILQSKMFLKDAFDLQPCKIGFLANLDSNIISMLPQFFEATSSDDAFNELITHIINDKISVSAIPYCLEDSLNFSGMRNNIKVYKSLLYYSLLRRLVDEQKTTNYKLQASDYLDADELNHMMKSSRLQERDYERRARSIYCFLLKTYIIAFSSKKSAKHKLMELVYFVNNRLGLYLECGFILSYLYFENVNNDIKVFFQKIQRNTIDAFKKIEGMAWDLFHVWDMPTEMAITSKQFSAIILQSLVTGDAALANITTFNPINRIFIYKDEAQVKYKYNIESFINDKSVVDELINYRSQRELLCKTVDLISLSKELEHEFNEVIKKSPLE